MLPPKPNRINNSPVRFVAHPRLPRLAICNDAEFVSEPFTADPATPVPLSRCSLALRHGERPALGGGANGLAGELNKSIARKKKRRARR